MTWARLIKIVLQAWHTNNLCQKYYEYKAIQWTASKVYLAAKNKNRFFKKIIVETDTVHVEKTWTRFIEIVLRALHTTNLWHNSQEATPWTASKACHGVKNKHNFFLNRWNWHCAAARRHGLGLSKSSYELDTRPIFGTIAEKVPRLWSVKSNKRFQSLICTLRFPRAHKSSSLIYLMMAEQA